MSAFLFLQALLLNKLSVAKLLEGALLRSEIGQLFLLHHLQQRLLHCLANQHLQDGLHLDVEVKQLKQSTKQFNSRSF